MFFLTTGGGASSPSSGGEYDVRRGSENVVEVVSEEYGLDAACVVTMSEHIPDFALVSDIEDEGTRTLHVTLSNGSDYYVITNGEHDIEGEGEAFCITTTEEDYDARTRLYDKFA